MIRRTPILAAVLLGAAVLLAGCGGDPAPAPEGEVEEQLAEEQPAEQPPEELPPLEDEEEGAGLPISSRRVSLYFPSASDSKLVRETREIFDTASPGDRAKQILSDLLEGPRGRGALRVVPRGVRLRQVYVTPGGVAYADFSSDLKFAVSGGSTDEILAVYSIVNSLVLNIDEIRKVAILVDGVECETLSGHVDLRRPLPANRGLLR